MRVEQGTQDTALWRYYRTRRWTMASWIIPWGDRARNTAGNVLVFATAWGKEHTALLCRALCLPMSNPWRISWKISEPQSKLLHFSWHGAWTTKYKHLTFIPQEKKKSSERGAPSSRLITVSAFIFLKCWTNLLHWKGGSLQRWCSSSTGASSQIVAHTVSPHDYMGETIRAEYKFLCYLDTSMWRYRRNKRLTNSYAGQPKRKIIKNTDLNCFEHSTLNILDVFAIL